MKFYSLVSIGAVFLTLSSCDVYERESRLTLAEPPSAAEDFDIADHPQFVVSEDGSLSLNGVPLRLEELAVEMSKLPSNQVGNPSIISTHPGVTNGRLIEVRQGVIEAGYSVLEIRIISED